MQNALQEALNGNKPVTYRSTEWRAAMMGCPAAIRLSRAARVEKTLYPSQASFLDNTCYRCHGVMGQRQVESDTRQPFKHDMVYALPDQPDGKYGALARDGVSCSACHRISKDDLGKPETFTGKFKLDAPDVTNGPYEKPTELPMKNALGITPRETPHIKTSALCGSCHTVILPVFDQNGRQVKDKNGKPKEFHEQMTYPSGRTASIKRARALDRAQAKTFRRHPPKLRDLVCLFASDIEETPILHDGRAPTKTSPCRCAQVARHTWR